MFSLSNQEHVLSSSDTVSLSLSEPLEIYVSGYSGEIKLASDNFELSMDTETWAKSVTIDFTPIMGTNIWARPDTESTGTIKAEHV